MVGKESSHPDSHETFVQVGLSLVTLKARRSESVSICAALLLGMQAPVAWSFCYDSIVIRVYLLILSLCPDGGPHTLTLMV